MEIRYNKLWKKVKEMSGFSELIKNFEKTRSYLRDFFIYGYKVRGDFQRKSGRTYDDEKRRVESWLDGFLKYENSPRGKQLSISVDSSRVSENPLYKAYYTKSFTDNDIRLHFMLLDILSDEKRLSLKQLIIKADERFGIIFDEQTVRNKLKEYTEEGLIISQKQGKTAYFSLSEDRIPDYLNEFQGLSDALKFYSESNVFGIIGNSILKSAGLVNDLFRIKHNYIVHTLDDPLLTDIIAAIDEKRYISMRSFTSKNNFSHEYSHCIIPMQISVSDNTGRQYVIGYIPEYRRFHSFRLDFIRSIKKGNVCEEYDTLYEKYRKNISRCFGSSFGDRHERGAITPLKVTVAVNEQTEEYIIHRLEREKRCGSVRRSGEGLYEITIDTFDPVEPIHWIKSFIGRIVSIEGGSETVHKLFYEDIRRMDIIYNGENTDEHIQ